MVVRARVLRAWVLVVLAWSAAAHTPDDYDPAWGYNDKAWSSVNEATCRNHLAFMDKFQFVDASFRIPQGLLIGNTVDYGQFHQCLAIRQHLRDGDLIQGKHCMFRTELLLPPKQMIAKAPRSTVEVRLGVCIPLTCGLQQALPAILPLPNNVTEESCRVLGDKVYTGADVATVCILIIIGIVTVASTSYEIYVNYKGGKSLNKVWSSFSLLTNTRRLFSMEASPGAITCLDGVRSLALLWVILGHTVGRVPQASILNHHEASVWIDTTLGGCLARGADVSVDSFFFLSGLLLLYVTAQTVTTPEQLVRSVPGAWVWRAVRLGPALGAGAALAVALQHAADGANWSLVTRERYYCVRYWWPALLHIQNYYNPDDICLPHTWYLSVDSQLQVLGAGALLLAWRRRRRRGGGVAAAALVALVVTAAAAVFSYVVVANNPDNYHELYYVNTLTRAPVFTVGMLAGHLLLLHQRGELRIPKYAVAAGWTTSMVLFVVVLWTYHEPSTTQNFMEVFKRPLWGISLGWLVLACYHGYGGPIDKFLSSRAWRVWSRLSYSLFIVHHPLQFVTAGSVTAPFYFTPTNLFSAYMYDVWLGVAAAMMVWLLVEAPFASLARILLTRSRNTDATADKPDILSTMKQKENEDDMMLSETPAEENEEGIKASPREAE